MINGYEYFFIIGFMDSRVILRMLFDCLRSFMPFWADNECEDNYYWLIFIIFYYKNHSNII